MKIVDPEWRRFSVDLKNRLIKKFIEAHGLMFEFTKWRLNRINLGCSLGENRDFRSFCKLNKIVYSQAVSWMVGYHHFVKEAIEIAKTKLFVFED